jgi:ABC-type transport system involved in multi-copper enzyme maturation permease subunit
VIATLRYEWVRISTVRSTRICLVLAFLIAAGLGYLIAQPSEIMDAEGNLTAGPIEWWGAFAYPLTFIAVLAAVVASQAIGQEYRFGLIRLTLTAFPARVQVLVAKVVMVVLACLALVAASYLGSFLGVSLRGHPFPPADVISPDSTYLVRGAVFVALWGISAFALAGFTRQTAIGIAVPIVSGLIVEQLVGAVLRDRAEWVVKVLPWSSAARWFQQPVSGDPSAGGGGSGFGLDDLPVGWAAVGVFAVWVAVFLAFEVVSFVRRDA